MISLPLIGPSESGARYAVPGSLARTRLRQVGWSFSATLLMIGSLACASNSEPHVAGTEKELNCSEPKVFDSVPKDLQVFSDVIALPTMRTHELGHSGTDTDPTSPLRFSKVPLLVRRNVSLSVSVADEQQDSVALSWGSSKVEDPVASIQVVGCEGDGEWLMFPGGFWTLDPACVRLTLVSAGESEEIRIPIGSEC